MLQYCGEFDNWGAIMSVSDGLLCSFELLKPLDSNALKSHIKKGRNKRNSMLNSPVSLTLFSLRIENLTDHISACNCICTKFLMDLFHISLYWRPCIRSGPSHQAKEACFEDMRMSHKDKKE